MDGVATRPFLSTKVPKRYGRHDYERFDNISSSHRVGHGMIGSVAIECRFLFTKSQWGTIGDNMNPAGIVYLDLEFHKPADTRIRSATILITLQGDERKGWQKQQVETSATHDNRSPYAVKFTDCYGPKHFQGWETSMWSRHEKHLTPDANVLGGIGSNTKQDPERRGRWRITGHLDASKGSIWYNRLKWHLEETELKSEPLHSNLVHTAFAFEHNASEFYMTVEVSGKLVGSSDRFKNRLMKFGGGDGKDRNIMTTKFQWSNGYHCPKRLDKVAQELSYAMEYENLYKVPFEMPGTLPASFQTVTGPKISESTSLSISEGRPWPPPRVSGSAQPGSFQVPNAFQTTDDEPTLDELIRAAGFGSTTETIPTRTLPNPPPEAVSSSSTLIGSGAENSSMQEVKPNEGPVEAEPANRADNEETDMEMVMWLMRIPFLALILKFLASIMGFRSRQITDGTVTDTDSESEGPVMANTSSESVDPDVARLNSQRTNSALVPGHIQQPMRRKRYSSFPVRLGKIDEVNPVMSLNYEAQEVGLEVPEGSTVDNSLVDTGFVVPGASKYKEE